MITGLSDYYGFDNISLQRSTTPNTLYVTCRDGAHHGLVLKSSDAGETWGVLYQGLKNESYNSAVFDGLVVGSERGLFSMKSKAKIIKVKVHTSTIIKGKGTSFTGVLKDATTKKLLKYKYVRVYRQVGKTWKLVNGIKTNKYGVFTVKVKPAKTTKYRLIWTPKRADSAEYARAISGIYTVTVKKK